MKSATIAMAVFALTLSAGAQDLAISSTEEKIPIQVERAVPVHRIELDNASLELEIDPTRISGSIDRDSQWAEQKFGLRFTQPLTDTWTLEHSVSAGFLRRDPFLTEVGNPALENKFSFSQQGLLCWRGPTGLSLSGRVGSLSTQSNAQPGFADSFNQGIQVAWKLSAATTVRVDAGLVQRCGLDSAIVHQDLYSLAIDHRLDAIPVSLHVAQTAAQEDHRDSAERSNDLQRFTASATWQLEPGATWALGVEASQRDFAEGPAEEFSNAYFTELKLDPGEALRVSMKASYVSSETIAVETPDLLSGTKAVTLTLGLNIKLSSFFGAGFSIRHRIDALGDEVSSSEPTYFSFSGSAYF
jgi:hypothetical protein